MAPMMRFRVPATTPNFSPASAISFACRKAEDALRHEARIAQEGQQIAHTAFEALAVTEKMTSDAFSLDRRLKIGLASLFALAVLMAGTLFLFARSAQKQNQRTTKFIAGLEGGIIQPAGPDRGNSQAARGAQGSRGQPRCASQGRTQKAGRRFEIAHGHADPSSDELAALQSQLAETNARLQRVEQERGSAQSLIPADVQSVCLLHVSVAFRNQQIGTAPALCGPESAGRTNPGQQRQSHPHSRRARPGSEDGCLRHRFSRRAGRTRDHQSSRRRTLVEE